MVLQKHVKQSPDMDLRTRVQPALAGATSRAAANDSSTETCCACETGPNRFVVSARGHRWEEGMPILRACAVFTLLKVGSNGNQKEHHYKHHVWGAPALTHAHMRLTWIRGNKGFTRLLVEI